MHSQNATRVSEKSSELEMFLNTHDMQVGWEGVFSNICHRYLEPKYFGSIYLDINFFCGMATPLRPINLLEIEENALQWAILHPGHRARGLPREHRWASTLARPPYDRYQDHRRTRPHGISPCLLCGLWTHNWREACEHPSLGPLCRDCDAAGKV